MTPASSSSKSFPQYTPTAVLDALGLSISLATIHGLASLLDRGQHGIVRDIRFGGDVCSLRFEADIEGFDSYKT